MNNINVYVYLTFRTAKPLKDSVKRFFMLFMLCDNAIKVIYIA